MAQNYLPPTEARSITIEDFCREGEEQDLGDRESKDF